MEWQPVSSAPVDRDVLVRCYGGYSVARYDPYFRRWYASYKPATVIIVEPIEWMEIPKVSGETMATDVALKFEEMACEISKLRSALKPFADEASRWELHPDHLNSANDKWTIYNNTTLTVGDLRRAKEALGE